MLGKEQIKEYINENYGFLELRYDDMEKLVNTIYEENSELAFSRDDNSQRLVMDKLVLRYMRKNDSVLYNDYVELKKSILEAIVKYQSINEKYFSIEEAAYRIEKALLNIYNNNLEMALKCFQREDVEWLVDVNSIPKEDKREVVVELPKEEVVEEPKKEEDAISYIYEFIDKNKDSYGIDNKEVVDLLSKEIAMSLYRKGYTDSRIIKGRYDKEIDKNTRYYLMKANSTGKTDKSNKKEHNFNISDKVKNKIVVGLITTAVVASMIGGGALIVNNLEDRGFISGTSVSDVAPVVDYEFPPIWYSGNDNYEKMVQAVMDYYNNSLEYEEKEYCYLGFYEAYNSVMNNKLDMMDKVLGTIKAWSNNQGDEQLHQDVSKYDCFLDLVYDRVSELTNDDLRRYDDAIKAYKEARAEYPEEIAYKKLSEDNKSSIDKLMNKYSAVSKKEVDNYEDHREEVMEKKGGYSR